MSRSPFLCLIVTSFACSPLGGSDEGSVASSEPWRDTHNPIEAVPFQQIRDGIFQASLSQRTDLARISADGVNLRGTVDVRFVGWGRAAVQHAASHASPVLADCAAGDDTASCAPLLEVDHGAVTEWFVARKGTLRQGWDVYEAPDGDGPLTLSLSVDGAEWVEIGDAGLGATITPVGGGAFSYGGLVAWDAEGLPLDSWMERTHDGIDIRVDDAEATYPITIDPDYSSFISLYESAYLFALSVTAGDFDGDGYSDVVAGSESANAFVYYGSGTGLSTTAGTTISESSRSWPVDAADYDGDGYDDLFIGSIGSGYGYLYYGTSSGLSTSSTVFSGTSYGYGAAAGDFDGDGHLDMAMSAQGNGYIHIFEGSASGPSTKAAQSISEGSYTGASLDACDITGDGYDDLIFNRGGTSNVYLYLGSASGLATASAWSTTGEQYLGTATECIGDVDGDGYQDAFFGQYNDSTGFVYYGASTGFDTSRTLELSEPEGRFGEKASAGGDLDGDGYDDLVVGAKNTYTAFIYPGSAKGIDPSSYTQIWGYGSGYGYFGESSAPAGDVDGDGNNDLIIGGSTYGYVYVTPLVDDDGDGYWESEDCDDTDASVYPGAADACGDGIDADCDGIGDTPETDDEDEDGLTAAEEALAGASDCALDTDEDGLSDVDEINKHGTDPASTDTDKDGLSDAEEIGAGTNPLSGDSDEDGLSDAEELEAGTDPLLGDTDGDGLSDATEIEGGTDPLLEDTDGDGLGDGEEVNAGTNPLDEDTDGDGLSDAEDPDPLTAEEDDDDNNDDDTGNVDDPDTGVPAKNGGCSCSTSSAPTTKTALLAAVFGFVLVGRRRE